MHFLMISHYKMLICKCCRWVWRIVDSLYYLSQEFPGERANYIMNYRIHYQKLCDLLWQIVAKIGPLHSNTTLWWWRWWWKPTTTTMGLLSPKHLLARLVVDLRASGQFCGPLTRESALFRPLDRKTVCSNSAWQMCAPDTSGHVEQHNVRNDDKTSMIGDCLPMIVYCHPSNFTILKTSIIYNQFPLE